MFLNNRYYDPTVGVFTSVDPLVGKTGTPYLYGAGNPSTLTDPTGLDACKSITCDSGQVSNVSVPLHPLDDRVFWDAYNDHIRYYQEEWQKEHLSDDVRYALAQASLDHRGVHGICTGLGNCLAKLGVVAVSAVAQAGCGAGDALSGGALAACHGVVAGATSWGLHAVDGDYSVNAGDVLVGVVAGGFTYLGEAARVGAPKTGRATLELSDDVSAQVTFGHGARHLEGTGLSARQVESSILQQVASQASQASSTGSFWGRVEINGVTIEYRAYTLADGTINVGTYYESP